MNSVVSLAEVESLLRRFFELLVAHDLDGLASDGRFLGMTPGEIVGALDGYPAGGPPGRPSMPPDAAFREPRLLEPYEDRALGRQGWAVHVDLYFDEERSDLTLLAIVYRNEHGECVLEVFDIHAM